MYRDAGPGKTPYLIQAQIFTDSQTRVRAITQAERKAAQGGAGAYMYIWEWVNPSFDGKFGAVHGHDVDASFNLYRQNMCGSGEKDGRKMTLALASAWIAFAKTGNPDNEHIPHWPKYDAATRATMIFDAEHARRQRSARCNADVLRQESRSGNGGSGRLVAVRDCRATGTSPARTLRGSRATGTSSGGRGSRGTRS